MGSDTHRPESQLILEEWMETLTDEEREVLILKADGVSVNKISNLLGCGRRYIESQLESIKIKYERFNNEIT